jgi:energy-coupling factor transporter ATP-binding protein EcfA2
MPIVNLRLSHLGPLEDIAFTFDEHVNVFVGPNNCGKSTALTALGNILACLVEIPSKLYRQKPTEFVLHFVGTHGEVREFRGVLPIDLASTERLTIWADMLQTLGYTVFVPALRQSTGFRAPWSVNALAGASAPQHPRGAPGPGQSPWETPEIPEELRRRRALLPTNPVLIRDEVAIESLVELNSRAYRWNDPALHGIIAQVATIASEITEGFPMQFLRVAEDQEGLFPQFSTPDGDVPFNVLSQGTQSVMQWLTFVLAGYAKYYGYPTNLAAQPGVVIIDEIDAHLHPAAQRRVIPALQRHFPKLQIFCSTHSPLMLAGLKTPQMQLFQRDAHGKVTLSRHETDIVGWSVDEILHGLLGVEHLTALEAERRLRHLQELRRLETPSAAETTTSDSLPHTASQTPPDTTLQHLAAQPLAPTEAPPPAAVPTPPAKPQRTARAKRSAGKTKATSTARRPSRSK